VDLEAQPLGPRPKGKRAARGNAPKFDLRTELYRIPGADWSRVNGIDVQVAPSAIAEVGVDRKVFPSEKHFANWLGVCPTNETSGGRVLKRRTSKVVNRAKVAFRQPASSLIRNRSYLGAQIPPAAYPIGRAQSHHRDGPHGYRAGFTAPQGRAAIRR
jgi:transposase